MVKALKAALAGTSKKIKKRNCFIKRPCGAAIKISGKLSENIIDRDTTYRRDVNKIVF